MPILGTPIFELSFSIIAAVVILWLVFEIAYPIIAITRCNLQKGDRWKMLMRRIWLLFILGLFVFDDCYDAGLRLVDAIDAIHAWPW